MKICENRTSELIRKIFTTRLENIEFSQSDFKDTVVLSLEEANYLKMVLLPMKNKSSYLRSAYNLIYNKVDMAEKCKSRNDKFRIEAQYKEPV